MTLNLNKCGFAINRRFHKKSVCVYWFLVLLVLTCGACSGNKFKLKGEITNGDNQSIILEKSDFYGNWMALDSTRIGSKGSFSLSFPSPASPDIYRLSLNGRYIYIPVDSTETITVTSSLEDFGRDFQLSGSKNAELLAQFEKELLDFDGSSPEAMHEFKRNVFTNYMKDNLGEITSFYILTKTISGKPLYNPSDPEDVKFFGAVATGYKNLRPDDPRTTLLEETSLMGLKKKNSDKGSFRQIEAEEISLIDLDLINENGQNVTLSSLTGQGKPVVVIFSLMNQEDSPAFNIELSKIYDKYNGGVIFYNVALDQDQYAWREAAANLPWITVYSPGGLNSSAARNYNLNRIPAFYLYDAKGDLVASPFDLSELEKSL